MILKANNISIFIFLLIITLVYGDLAWAQEHSKNQPSQQIEELIVTAVLRERTPSKIANSLTVVDAKSIADESALHLQDLISIVPNVGLSAGSSRARYFQIRGIGERSQFQEPLNPSVGFIVDDVDFSWTNAAGILFDVSQVEFLRGPQGTRYGSNSLAGLINIKTVVPSAEVSARLTTGIGTYSSSFIGGALGGPLTEKLFYRIASYGYKSNGFIRNSRLSRDDTNSINDRLWRVKLRWLPTTSMTVDMHWTDTREDNGYDAFSLDNNRITFSDEPGSDIRTASAGGVKFAWEGEFVDLEGIINFANSTVDYGYDEDWSYVGFHPEGYSSTDRYIRNNSTSSAELRALGSGFENRFDWVAGFYMLTNEIRLARDYTFFAQIFTSNYKVKQFATFAEARINVAEKIAFSAGLRVEAWQSEYDDSEQIEFSPQENLWGGLLAVEWTPSNAALIYLSIAKGYKAGGANIESTLDLDLRRFSSENLYNLEIGVKNNWFTGRLLSSFSLFYMFRSDVQISSSLTRTRDDGSSRFIVFLDNAAAGRNYGAEAEIKWMLSDNWVISLGVGLLFSEYRDFINSSGEDLSGREQAHAPNYQYRVAVEYKSRANWYFRTGVEGQDEFFFSDSHNAKSDPYDLLNLRIGYRKDYYEVAFWGRNLSNVNYQTRGFFFGNDPRNGYTSQLYYQLGEPRNFGFEFNLSF